LASKFYHQKNRTFVQGSYMATNSFVSEDSRNSAASVAIGGILLVSGAAALVIVGPEIAATVAIGTIISSAGSIAAGSAMLLGNIIRPALEEIAPASTTDLQWNAFRLYAVSSGI
jgi:hypothetical protein